MAKTLTKRKREFCEAFLSSMDPVRAARLAGLEDGYGLLREPEIRAELKRMREAMEEQICREDVVRRLSQLAFGRANDAVALTGEPGTEDPDLSLVAEWKRNSAGAVEVKLLDRVRALEQLGKMLGGGSDERRAADFFRALEDAGRAGMGDGD